MPIQNYGVLVGTVSAKLDSPAAKLKNPGGSPHYEILVTAAGTKYRIAVNVKSDQQPPDLQFFLDENYKHPILTAVKAIAPGFTKLSSQPNTAALDFIRGNLFDIQRMRIVPAVTSGANNDLNDIFSVYVDKAINTPGALIYAFGSKWGPETKKDDYFDFTPGNGIHDIHMNQGNKGSHAGDNGVYQDGALFIHYPGEDRWVAMFLKFQSQEIHTDDTDATPIPAPTPGAPLPETVTAVFIIAALVNPKADDTGKEAVYLLNTTDKDISLEGWAIADKLKKKELIKIKTIKAGEVLRLQLSGTTAQLSNDGGIITLLNKEGLKIHGVSYTKEDAQKQGYVVKF